MPMSISRSQPPRNVRIQTEPGGWLVTWTLSDHPLPLEAHFKNESAARLLHRNMLQMDAIDTPLTLEEAALIVQNAQTVDKNITAALREEQKLEREALKSLHGLEVFVRGHRRRTS